MKVRCTQLLAHDGRGQLESSPWLTIDAEYHVLSLTAHPDGRVYLRLLTDDSDSYGLFDSTAFMTVDETVPENWQARIGDGGVLHFAPASWLVPGFWEDYYDGDPAAAEIVKTELRKILSTQRDPRMPDLSGPMTSLELQAAAEQLATARGTDRWKGLMLVLLHYIKELPAPKELSDVMATVDAYWTSGKGTPATLEAARAKCRNP
ncbi:hypothetical protein AB4Y87_19735 [Paenarthrobacter sp. RAF54_2]|uniref:hypothetical protein n=1 Tax=Paenarthrobacter sp. RAF54_2 TaxID=3233061 RepID=UPI003F9976A9